MLQTVALARTLVPVLHAFQAVGLRTSAGYGQIRQSLFPAPIKDGRRSLVPSDELDAVIAARIAGQTEDQIRELVQRLHRERSALAA